MLPERGEQAFLNLLNRLGHAKKTRWNVHIRERYRHGAGVATYAARYMRGGPLKNRQLVAFDGQDVTFTYHDHRASASDGSSARRMRLPVERFIGRILQHVVPLRTQMVRCYGLYHASQAGALRPVQAELGQPPDMPAETPSWQAVGARQGDLHPERGPVCGQGLVKTGTVARRGGPGPPEIELGRVA